MTQPFYKVREVTDIRDLVRQSAELYADLPAFEVKADRGEIKIKTFAKYMRDINRLGTALVSMGYKDQKIAVAGKNCYEWFTTYMAVVCGVGVIVPIDKELLITEIKNILSTAEVKLLVCDRAFYKKIAAARSELDPELKIVIFDQKEDTEETLSYSKLKTKGKKLLECGNTEYLDAVINPEDVCSLLFTSGTTGASKAVMLCHRNICSDVMLAMQVIKVYANDKGLTILPAHHTYEALVSLFVYCYMGVCLAFCDGLRYIAKNFKEYSPTVFCCVPLLLENVHSKIMKSIKEKKNGERMFRFAKAAVKAGDKVKINLRKMFFSEIQAVFGGRLRLVIVGAAPVPADILEDFTLFGVQVVCGYGLTECSPLVICNNDKVITCDSIGVPLPEVEVKIINKEPETGIGELCIRGPMVMKGYYKNPEETARVIDEDNFFHTGDLGYCDRRGLYYITGRCKNVIVTKNGKNIYPEEVESYLSNSPYIAECLVREGIKDGEAVVQADVFPDFDAISAYLCKENPSAGEIESLIESAVGEANEHLASYKRIKKIKIRNTEFEKTSTKKIRRFSEANLK
ncbi:MAG: AMP-binding protein [Clostridia bacterium]|nr:AMP-binding protein [Clostridia bacterium]